MFNHPVFGYVPAPIPTLDAEWDALPALTFRADEPDERADVLGSTSRAVRQPCPHAQVTADRRRAIEKARDVRALIAARACAAAKKAEQAARRARARADLAAARLANAEDMLATYE